MVKSRILAQICAASLVMLAAVPAFAQYYPDLPYPQPQPYYQQQRPYYPPEQPEYQPPPRPPQFYRQETPYYQQQQPSYGYRRRPPQVSNICATSRGICYIDVLAPVSARCRCEVPGFGLKRGNVIAQ